MSGRFALALGPGTVEELRRLAPKFGETTVEGMVGRAIALMSLISDYMDEGSLTVVHPSQLDQLPPDVGVDLVFRDEVAPHQDKAA
jgi:hypothetical protein